MVLEHNTFAKKVLTDKTPEQSEENVASKSEQGNTIIECTPLKNPATKTNQLLDAMFSPIMDQSVLETPNTSEASESFIEKDNKQNETTFDSKTIPHLAFTLSDSYFEKSVLHSYESSVAEGSNQSIEIEKKVEVIASVSKKEVAVSPLGDYSIDCRSVLKDTSSLMTSDSDFDMKDETQAVEVNVEIQDKLAKIISDVTKAPVDQTMKETEKPSVEQTTEQRDKLETKVDETAESRTEVKNDLRTLKSITNDIQKQKQAIVDIEREIHEIEVDISDDESASGDDDESNDGSTDEAGSDEDVDEQESGGEDEENDSVIIFTNLFCQTRRLLQLVLIK